MSVLVETGDNEPWGKLVADLKRRILQPCSIVLAGAPGTGKWTAIQAAARDRFAINTVDLEFDGQHDPKAVKKAVDKLARCGGMQLCNGGCRPAVVVVFGFECLTLHNNLSSANPVLKAAFQHERCIVHLNNPTGLVIHPPAALLWAKGFTWNSLDNAINSIPGHGALNFDDRLELKRTDGVTSKDLRKVMLNAQALIQAKQFGGNLSSTLDAAQHKWFDTARFVRGERVAKMSVENIYACRDWIRANIGQTVKLEDAAAVAQHMAETDEFAGQDEWGNRDGLQAYILRCLGISMQRTRAVVSDLVNPGTLKLPTFTRKQTQAAIYALDPAAEAQALARNREMHTIHGNGTPGDIQILNMCCFYCCFNVVVGVAGSYTWSRNGHETIMCGKTH